MTTDTAGGTAPASTESTTGAGFDWAGTLGQDYDTFKPVLEGDKITDPKSALAAYATLKQQSATAVSVPGENATPEELNAFYAKIGRPEKADGYQLAKPEGFQGYDDTMANWFKTTAHTAGLNGKQAAAMHDAWVNLAKTQAQSSATEAANQERALSSEMDKEWGSQKSVKIDLAKRGARAFGFDAAMLDKLESNIGSFKMLNAFARIGEAVGEDSLHGGKSSGGGSNPWAKESFNLTQQARIMRESPQDAARMMAQAGISPNRD